MPRPARRGISPPREDRRVRSTWIRPGERSRVALALGLAMVVGIIGVAPHVAFSIREGGVAWFYNSYDEGYYGWAALHESVLHRVLAGFGLRVLTACLGGHLDYAMIAADFTLPALCSIAACFAVSACTRTTAGMGVGAMLLLMSSELLGFRSILSPTHAILPTLASWLTALDPRPDGVFVLGNETSVFWLFRTPEPQISWVVMFVVIGCAARMLLGRGAKWTASYAVACAFGGLGYLLALLPLFGALTFAGMLVFLRDRRLGILLAAPALAGGAMIFMLATLSALQLGADSLVFPSRVPAILFSGIFGAGLAGFLAIRAAMQRCVTVLSLAAMALALSPLLMANQQMLTGRMLYLLNFENFGFPQLVVAGLLLAIADGGEARLVRLPVPLLRLGTVGALAGLVAILGISQAQGYQKYLFLNQELQANVDALRNAGVRPGDRVHCTNLYMADVIAIALGWRPDLLLCRDVAFFHPVSRLDGSENAPEGRERFQGALFEAMALQGITVEEFRDGLRSLAEPGSAGGYAHFFYGSFLYNYADFWAPLTHGRDSRSKEIAAEVDSLTGQYAEFLRRDEWPSKRTFLVGKIEKRWIRDLSSRRSTVRHEDTKGQNDRPIRSVTVDPWQH